MAGSAGSPPALRRPGSLIATSEVLWDVDVTVAPTPPLAEPREREADGDRHRIMEHGGGGGQPPLDDRIVNHHFTCDVPEQPAAEPDDPRVTVHEACQDARAPHDDRQRQPDSEHDEHQVA